MALSRRSCVEKQKSINDVLPAEVLQIYLFEQSLNIWERPILEQVCKHWKQLMPYLETSLDVSRLCKEMSKNLHVLDLIYSSYSAVKCYHLSDTEERAQRWVKKCLKQMLVGRKMGSQLKDLIFDKLSVLQCEVQFDLKMAKLITDNCNNLWHFKLIFSRKCSPGVLREFLQHLNLNSLESLELGDRDKHFPIVEPFEFDFILQHAPKLRELKLL